MGAAAFARADPTDELGTVGDGLFGMEGALATGEALTDDFGVFTIKILIESYSPKV